MLPLILLALCASNIVYSKQVDFSQIAKPCPRDIADYPECTRRALEKSWPRLVAGIPEINLPRLDPLVVDNFNGTAEYGVSRVKYNVSNITVYGFANAKFLSVDSRLGSDYFHLEIGMYQPKFFVEADYEGEGGYGEFIIAGKGHMNVSMTDVTTKVVLDGPIINDRWVVEKVNITPRIGDMKLWASDLFNGNKAFTEEALAFFNANWRIFYEIGLSVMQGRLNASVKGILNKISTEVPFSQAFS